jgi:hypothetical protein
VDIWTVGQMVKALALHITTCIKVMKAFERRSLNSKNKTFFPNQGFIGEMLIPALG